VNQIGWLWEQVHNTRNSILLATNKLTLEEPAAEGLNWLDALQNLLQQRVKVRLYINQLPDPNSGDGEAILVATHLRLLLRKGLDLRQSRRRFPWAAVIDPATAMPLAVRTSNQKTFSLAEDDSHQFEVTNNSDSVREAWQVMKSYGRSVDYIELREPPHVTITEVLPDNQKHSETEYFAGFYAGPVIQMLVNDRYLNTREKILNRLGAHITLAHSHGQLESVTVQTRESGQEQKEAITQLKSRFPQVDINVKLSYHTAHDRSIEILRDDGTKARVILGVGLEFIQTNGSVRHTFLVFQDPYLK
jgi:hypothetical protein